MLFESIPLCSEKNKVVPSPYTLIPNISHPQPILQIPTLSSVGLCYSPTLAQSRTSSSRAILKKATEPGLKLSDDWEFIFCLGNWFPLQSDFTLIPFLNYNVFGCIFVPSLLNITTLLVLLSVFISIVNWLLFSPSFLVIDYCDCCCPRVKREHILLYGQVSFLSHMELDG